MTTMTIAGAYDGRAARPEAQFEHSVRCFPNVSPDLLDASVRPLYTATAPRSTIESSRQVFERRSKIVCTIGPASDSPEALEKLIYAGMDVARLNFSHGSHA